MTAFSAKDAVKRSRTATLGNAIHSVRRTTISKRTVSRRYALSRADGRSDLECSRWDNANNARLETNEKLDATAAGVRMLWRFVVAHSSTIVNCNTAKTPIAPWSW